jgi:hypothetical protein
LASTARDMPQNNDSGGSPFRYRDFRIFWTGSFFSSIGSQFTTVAMAWQIYELTHSPFQLGLLGLARALPQMVLLLVAGLLADAINRRKLMIFTQTGLCCVSATLALLTFAGRASPQLLYVATMLLAIFSSLELPSRQSLIPNLVPRQDLAQALALQGTGVHHQAVRHLGHRLHDPVELRRAHPHAAPVQDRVGAAVDHARAHDRRAVARGYRLGSLGSGRLLHDRRVVVARDAAGASAPQN